MFVGCVCCGCEALVKELEEKVRVWVEEERGGKEEKVREVVEKMGKVVEKEKEKEEECVTCSPLVIV